MEEKTGTNYSPVLAAVLFAAVLAVILVLPRSFIRFTGLQNTKWNGDTVYGINLNGSVTEIFELSSETGEGRFLRVEEFDRKGATVFPDLEIMEDGEVCLVEEKYSGEGEVTLALVRWNLKKNRLEPLWELPEESGSILVDFMIRGGNYCFLFYNNGDGSGKSLRAFNLTPEGSYLPAEYNAEDDWSLSITGVSLDSMPYPGVRMPVGKVFRRLLLVFLLALGVELIFWICWQWWRTRDYRPGLLVRLTLGTAGVFVLLMCLFYGFLKNYLYDYVSKNEIYASMVESELFSRMMNRDVLDDLTEGRTSASTEEFSEMLKAGGGINAAVAWYTDDGLIVTGDLFERGIYESTVTEGSLKDCVDEVYGTEEVKGFLYAGRRGMHAMTLRPEKTASGKDTVLCVQIPMRQFLHAFHEILVRVISVCQMAALCILVSTGLVLGLCLSPLKRLRNAVSELASGKLDTRVRVGGHNELASVATEFNLMAEELENTRAGTDIYRRFYEAFWPMDLLRKITGKRFNSSLKPGTDTGTRAVTLAVKAAGTERLGEKERQELLAGLIDIIRDHGGSAVSFSGDRISAVFPGPAKDALTAALLMQRKIGEMTGQTGHMGMASGDVRLHVIGYRERRAVLTEDSTEAWKLCELAEIYREGLILTAAVAEAAGGPAGEFHFRHLGKVAVGEYCPKEELYELLDAESAERRRIREMSLTQFETGVSAYAAKDYFTARIAMIACLNTDPEDRAARSYCINCDRKEPPVICQAER